MEIGYLYVMDGLVFGFYEWGEVMIFVEFRVFFDGMIIGNCGYIKEEVEKCLFDGDGDMIVFGRFWIMNLDFLIWFKYNYFFEFFDDLLLWYGGGVEGYNDFEIYCEKSGKDVMILLIWLFLGRV